MSLPPVLRAILGPMSRGVGRSARQTCLTCPAPFWTRYGDNPSPHCRSTRGRAYGATQTTGAELRRLRRAAGLARTLLPELAKIGVTSLSTRSMLSADVAGRARAVGTLVGAGVPLEQAMQLVGWGKDDGGTYE